ncbi:MAG: spore cortex biosynthesis protein YabQ [Acutalibacteraceae bacterium]
MTYGISTSVQLSNFLFAAGFGFLEGILYFLIVLFRKIISSKKKAVIVQDIFFGAVTAILCFDFMQVYCDGQVRIDLIIAAMLGFFLLIYTAGKSINTISDKISAFIKKIIKLIFAPLMYFKKLLKRLFISISVSVKKKREGIKISKSERENNKSVNKVKKKENKKINKHKKSNKIKQKSKKNKQIGLKNF